MRLQLDIRAKQPSHETANKDPDLPFGNATIRHELSQWCANCVDEIKMKAIMVCHKHQYTKSRVRGEMPPFAISPAPAAAARRRAATPNISRPSCVIMLSRPNAATQRVMWVWYALQNSPRVFPVEIMEMR